MLQEDVQQAIHLLCKIYYKLQVTLAMSIVDSTHICLEKMYTKNQQCSCILGKLRGPGWNLLPIYKQEQ